MSNGNGKGDTPRPLSVDNKTFENNWERTFKGNQRKIDKKIEELQKDIETVRQKLDNCEYSGLPSPTSYELSEEYQSAINRVKKQEDIRIHISDLNTLGE